VKNISIGKIKTSGRFNVVRGSEPIKPVAPYSKIIYLRGKSTVWILLERLEM
jgi:hypothetical protein